MDAPASANLREVRTRIDALDAQIVRLLAERFACAREAASFKTSAAQVPAPERAAQVIANVRRMATEHGAPPEAMERVYRALIDAMIAMELDLHQAPPEAR
ncbi:MAG: chorismate mutase [Candidatus Parcubacteria bacterium]|nr:chorismate mutase [Burkholderiales bacterium]